MENQFQRQAVIKAVDKVSAPIHKIMNNLTALDRQFKSVGQAASKFGSNLQSLFSSLSALGGAARIAGILRMTKSLADYGDMLKNTATSIGWSAKTLQEYSYAAKFSNLTSEEFTSSLVVMSKQLGQLRAGTGSLASGLKNLSPLLLQQIKAANSNEEAFELMMQAIQKVEDPLKKAHLATLFFGQSGRNMVHLANQGADGLKKLRQEALATGNVLGDDALNAATSFNASIARMTRIMAGLTQTIGSKLLPIITPMIEQITSWMLANRELIATKIETFIAKFAAWLQQIDFGKVLQALQKACKIIAKLVKLLGGAENAFIALLVIMNGGLIAAFISLGLNLIKLVSILIPFKALLTGLGTIIIELASLAIPLMIKGFIALGTAIMTTPIGWITAAIAGLAGAAYLIYKHWQPIKDFFIGLWDGVTNAFAGAWAFIKDSISKMGQWVLEKSGLNTVLQVIDKVRGWFSSSNNKTSGESIISPAGAPRLSASMAGLSAARDARAQVIVKFDNMPHNAAVNAASSGQAMDLGVETGYAMPAAVR